MRLSGEGRHTDGKHSSISLKRWPDGPITATVRNGRLTLSSATMVVAAALTLSGRAAAPSPDEASRGSAASVFEISGAWESDGGAALRLEQLPGRVRVVAMFYAGCHMACPVTVEGMQWIEKALPTRVAAGTEFVLVTLDPGGDTLQDLRAFRTEQRLSERWMLLRGNRTATRELADHLGVAFRHDSYRLTHTAVIVVIDESGRIVSRHTTLRPDLQAVVESVKSLIH